MRSMNPFGNDRTQADRARAALIDHMKTRDWVLASIAIKVIRAKARVSANAVSAIAKNICERRGSNGPRTEWRLRDVCRGEIGR